MSCYAGGLTISTLICQFQSNWRQLAEFQRGQLVNIWTSRASVTETVKVSIYSSWCSNQYDIVLWKITDMWQNFQEVSVFCFFVLLVCFWPIRWKSVGVALCWATLNFIVWQKQLKISPCQTSQTFIHIWSAINHLACTITLMCHCKSCTIQIYFLNKEKNSGIFKTYM